MKMKMPIVNSDDDASIHQVLTKTECKEIIESGGILGKDSTCTSFTKRTKNLCYVLSIGEMWYQLDLNYVAQDNSYNTLSGGNKRYHGVFPTSFVKNSAVRKLLNEFKKHFKIPDERLVLLQLQTSHIGKDMDCLTGQGIHTDGHDSAMVACLQVDKGVKGARSAIFSDSDGQNMILGPIALKEGQVMFFNDNKVYHYVEPAWDAQEMKNKNIVDDKHISISETKKRTVVLAHYPAYFSPTGERNPNNILSSSVAKHPKWSSWWGRKEQVNSH